MNDPVPAPDRSSTDIPEAYRQAAGRWIGCDWPTVFGETGLDLNGLHAAQALLMARATAGREATDWRAAVIWLNQIEEVARQAEAEAQTAVRLTQTGYLDEALQHARRACFLEARYHHNPNWTPLCKAIEAAWKQTRDEEPLQHSEVVRNGD